MAGGAVATMQYEFIALPDDQIPKAANPPFQHLVTTYVSENAPASRVTQGERMRHLLYCDTVGRLGSVGLLLVRLVMGAAFVLHGWPKIQNPFGWMGPDAPFPGFLMALAALAEFGGGIALIGGLLTRLASLGVASVMVVAISMVHLPQEHPFVSQEGHSWELAAVYLACAVLFLLLGPGRFSLDALLFGRADAPRRTETC